MITWKILETYDKFGISFIVGPKKLPIIANISFGKV
jgi:hypothetical protein